MSKEICQFKQEKELMIASQGADLKLREEAYAWMANTSKYQYTYHFEWLGRPIIQFPEDMVALQEIIWEVKPNLIIETGIAHGGSLILSASMLAMLDYCEAVHSGKSLDPLATGRRVLGIDIDLRPHNRAAIEAHPMAHRIDMIQGSSIEPHIIEQVQQKAKGHGKTLVCLDSNHTHDHVLAELNAYAPLVSKGSYCIVFDTAIEDMPENLYSNRPWGMGNNPKTAVWDYLKSHPEYEIDRCIENKLLITVAPNGYLRKTR